jgi:hypothetical protein
MQVRLNYLLLDPLGAVALNIFSSMYISRIFEKLTAVELVKKSADFTEPEDPFYVETRYILSQFNPVYDLTFYRLKIHFNITVPS